MIPMREESKVRSTVLSMRVAAARGARRAALRGACGRPDAEGARLPRGDRHAASLDRRRLSPRSRPSAAANDFTADDHRGRPPQFTEENLDRVRRGRLPLHHGDVLTPEQEAAFQAYIEAGGGFLGIHDAARAEPYSDWFTGLIGAAPDRRQPDGRAAGDRRGPATASTRPPRTCPLQWKRPDHWFNWAQNPPATCTPSPGCASRTYQPGTAPTARTTRSPGAATTTAAAPSTPAWAAPRRLRRDATSATTCAAPCAGPPASRGRLQGHDRRELQGRAAHRSPTIRPRPRQSTRSASRTAWSSRTTAASSTSAAAARDLAARGHRLDQPGRRPRLGHDPRLRPEDQAGHRSAGALDVFGNRGGGDELIKNEEGLLGIAPDPNFDTNG